MVSRALLSVVDDDESVRESLPDLLNAFGFDVDVYASGADFLASADLSRTACLILDVAMPVMSGLDLHVKLRRQGWDIPVVFITAHADDRVRPQALAQGAVDCLFKPFDPDDLLAALTSALKCREARS